MKIDKVKQFLSQKKNTR